MTQGNPASITLQGGVKYRIDAQGRKDDDAGKGAITLTGPNIDPVLLPMRGSRRAAFTYLNPHATTTFSFLLKNAQKEEYAGDHVRIVVGAGGVEIHGIRSEDEEPLVRVKITPEGEAETPSDSH